MKIVHYRNCYNRPLPAQIMKDRRMRQTTTLPARRRARAVR